jgi:hypothetical protein
MAFFNSWLPTGSATFGVRRLTACTSTCVLGLHLVEIAAQLADLDQGTARLDA